MQVYILIQLIKYANRISDYKMIVHQQEKSLLCSTIVLNHCPHPWRAPDSLHLQQSSTLLILSLYYFCLFHNSVCVICRWSTTTWNIWSALNTSMQWPQQSPRIQAHQPEHGEFNLLVLKRDIGALGAAAGQFKGVKLCWIYVGNLFLDPHAVTISWRID